MYYFTARDKLEEILIKENIILDQKNKDEIIFYLSKFYRYEEEESKIHPKLLIGNDIYYFLQLIPSKQVYTIKSKKDSIGKILKTLLPLANHGWYPFIQTNKTNGTLEYGVFKQTDSLTIADLSTMIFSRNFEASEIKDKSLISFSYFNSSAFEVRGIYGTNEVFSFNLFVNKQETSFVNYLVNNGSNDDVNNLKIFWNRYLNLLRQTVHGCICLYIDDTKKIDKRINNGIWLNSSLNFVSDLVKYKQSNDYLDFIKLKNEVELSLSLINNDGISIFDKRGNMLAYNVFVKSKEELNLAGGARRRAAESLILDKPNGCLAIYFQSQDGESFFKEL